MGYLNFVQKGIVFYYSLSYSWGFLCTFYYYSSWFQPSRWPALMTLPTLAKFQLVWHSLCDVLFPFCFYYCNSLFVLPHFHGLTSCAERQFFFLIWYQIMGSILGHDELRLKNMYILCTRYEIQHTILSAPQFGGWQDGCCWRPPKCCCRTCGCSMSVTIPCAIFPGCFALVSRETTEYSCIEQNAKKIKIKVTPSYF